MSRLPRKNAVPIEELLKEFIRENKLSRGLNTQKVFAAWDSASGAGKYTVRKFYRDGKLYITVSSSVIRSQLLFQKAALLERINAILCEDSLFVRDDPSAGLIKELIIK